MLLRYAKNTLLWNEGQERKRRGGQGQTDQPRGGLTLSGFSNFKTQEVPQICCWRNSGQRGNHTSLQYFSDEKRVCANRSLLDLHGFDRLLERNGQSIRSLYRLKLPADTFTNLHFAAGNLDSQG